MATAQLARCTGHSLNAGVRSIDQGMLTLKLLFKCSSSSRMAATLPHLHAPWQPQNKDSCHSLHDLPQSTGSAAVKHQ